MSENNSPRQIHIHAKSKPLVWLAVLLGIFLLSFLTFGAIEAASTVEEQQIRKETYISNLQDTYTRNIEDCSQAVLEANKAASEADQQKAVNEQCINPINGSRMAKLLVQWGYQDLLITK